MKSTIYLSFLAFSLLAATFLSAQTIFPPMMEKSPKLTSTTTTAPDSKLTEESLFTLEGLLDPLGKGEFTIPKEHWNRYFPLVQKVIAVSCLAESYDPKGWLPHIQSVPEADQYLTWFNQTYLKNANSLTQQQAAKCLLRTSQRLQRMTLFITEATLNESSLAWKQK